MRTAKGTEFMIQLVHEYNTSLFHVFVNNYRLTGYFGFLHLVDCEAWVMDNIWDIDQCGIITPAESSLRILSELMGISEEEASQLSHKERKEVLEWGV